MTIVIIGAGAAGMMAALTAREQNADARVLLIEKNAILGRKVLISGGGRCNVTTGIQDVRQVLTKYPRGSKFLTSAVYGFPPERVYEWFEERGVPLKIEADMRVFPQSNIGQDIVDVFSRFFEQSSVEVLLQEAATHVQKKENQFLLTLKSGKSVLADRLILTTGGQAYRHTGSTGDGYSFAETLGHSITELASSLNSFIVQEAWPKKRSGVSFKKVALRSKEYVAEGPIVFTHQGISGPAVFALAAQVAFEQYNKTHPLDISVDFVPELSQETVFIDLSLVIEKNPKQQLKTTLHAWLPASFVETLMHELHVPLQQTNAETSKEMRRKIVQWLKVCMLSAIGRGAGAEFVTAGGVSTDEVHPQTMESRIVPCLFFAGEILNIDGLTGGFNLQAAWATGALAGEYAAQE